MKKKTRIFGALLSGILLLAGCAGSSEDLNTTTVPPTAAQEENTAAMEQTDVASAEASLVSLRQAMVETPQLFAVAYFGYHDTMDSDAPVDPYAVMREQAPELCKDLPFLTEIPAERVIGNHGDLFCIVPLDEDATVAVSKGIWNETSEQYLYEHPLYFADSGEPILLFCNNAGFEPDSQLCIWGPSGDILWYPQADDNLCAMPLRNDNWDDLFFDFSPYRELLLAEYHSMNGEWMKPTTEMLIGTTWVWDRYLMDGREVSYQLTFGEDTLSVRWNDGIDAEDHEYPDAAWELTEEEGFTVLSIDFREFAGVLRYDLMYHEEFELLYVGMDVVQEKLPIGWEPLYRYLGESEPPEPVEMLGDWELAWTEVEGDRQEAEPGTCTIEILMSASSGMLMSYTSRELPHHNFENELLTFDERELHYGCGNDAWVADLNYVGPWDTTYTVTLTTDDILIKQNYFLLDGAPSVSYEYFRRVTGNMEYPYDYALSEGWRVPDLSQLMDTFWLSWSGYALELADNSVPGDNGGWAKLYDVDEIGVYTESYSGYWQYEDGLLYLSLVPAKGNGVFVDDSFPVLMLDGELRIGRTANGTGLPHFYSDMLMDTLEQPKG